MLRKILIALSLAAIGSTAQAALNPGDIAFTAFNADEDGLSFVTFADIAANTTIYFSDNEWQGTAFNTGESYNQWNSGSQGLAAGSVVRFSNYDKTSLSASFGTLSRVTLSGNTNWGISQSDDTIYAYLGSSATQPTTFLSAITNSNFDSTNGSLTGTGLVEGVTAIRLNANNPGSSPDYAEYRGIRSGLGSFAAYKDSIYNLDNWTIDSTDGKYASVIPETTAFSISPVPEPESAAMLLAGLGLIGAIARRRGVKR